MITNKQKKQYLAQLTKTYDDWQVKQADTALRFYQFYLSKQNEPLKKDNVSKAWRKKEEKLIEALRLRHRSLSTERTYCSWLQKFGTFLKHPEPQNLSSQDLQAFLSYLAVERHVSSSTQNQALNALVFFYRHVLDKDLTKQLNSVRARIKRRLPLVLSEQEVRSIFSNLTGINKLMAMLTYGCGLRLMECLRLRVKDIDFERNVLIVRSGKGDKDRRTVLPDSLKDNLIEHLGTIRKPGTVHASVRMFPIIFHSLSFSLLVQLTDAGFKRPGIGQLRSANKLPPMGPDLTPFRSANTDFFQICITGFTGRIYLPHLWKESQPLL